MIEYNKSLFRAHMKHPTLVHPAVLPPGPVKILRHAPDVIHSALKASPKGLVDMIKREAQAYDARVVCLADPLGLHQLLALGAELAETSHALSLAVTVKQSLPNDGEQLDVDPLIKSGIKCVNWVDVQGELGAFSQQLKAFSKAGIWNRVILAQPGGLDFVEAVARFVIANPNIAHSWQIQTSSGSMRSQIVEKIDTFQSTYSNYAPLPGRPFWQTLSDDGDLMLYLGQYGISRVKRWWISTDHQSLTRIGANMNYHFVKPHALSSHRLDDICELVAAGGSVDTKWVKFNLKRAFLIAYVTEMDRVVADSSLKHPRPEYITTLNEQTGMDLSDYLERGYTSVRPEYRGLGIGTRLLEGLTSRAQGRKIFSLISEDNVATQKIAIRNRTRKITTFFSQRAGKKMGVWMPEASVEE